MIAWLTADVPESTAQATAQSIWLGARRLLRNPLAVAASR